MTQLNFDARTVDPQQTFEPIPAGWYNMMIVESEMKPTSKGDGAYLQVTLKVVDGQHAGRQVFDRMNLQNPNPVAAEIGYKRLSAYCHATGVIQVQDSQQLHGIPFKARVSVRTDTTGQYDPSNEVKAVKHINEDTGTTAAQQWQAAPPAQPAAAAPAWTAPPQQQAPAQWAPPQQPAPQQAQPAPTAAAPWTQQPTTQAAPAAAQPPWIQQPAAQAAPPAQPAPAATGAAAPGPTPPWAQAKQ